MANAPVKFFCNVTRSLFLFNRKFIFIYRCLKDFNTVKHGSPESSVSRKIFSDHWNVMKAPLAGNIIWEHLSVDHESWWARALFINTLLFIVVLFLTTPTVVLSTIKELQATIGEQRMFAHGPSSYIRHILHVQDY